MNPTIELDAQGGQHMIYPAYAIGDAFYAYCPPAGCSRPEDVKVVKFETPGDGVCTGDCTERAGWSLEVIVDDPAMEDREVTGEALGLTPDGKPRFLMHTYRALFGIGQKPPATWYLACDANCTQRESWSMKQISTQIWQESALRFDVQGVPHVATVVQLESESGTLDLGAYFECKSNCDTEDGWAGLGLMNAYVDRNIARIDPAVALTLTPTGGARMVLLGENDAGVPRLQYLACDSGCDDISRWGGLGLVESENLGAGVDIALDGAGEAHVVFTANSDIFEFDCKEDCFSPDEAWTLTPVERGSEMKPDEIIPYADCTVAAWFLRHPSVAADAQGHTYVVYRAEDISGGGTNHNDPNKPHCRAGVDATYARHRSLP